MKTYKTSFAMFAEKDSISSVVLSNTGNFIKNKNINNDSELLVSVGISTSYETTMREIHTEKANEKRLIHQLNNLARSEGIEQKNISSAELESV